MVLHGFLQAQLAKPMLNKEVMTMKAYEKLEIELVKFNVEDVICTSGWDVKEEGSNEDTGDNGAMYPINSLFN